jgi:hypothetical protein
MSFYSGKDRENVTAAVIASHATMTGLITEELKIWGINYTWIISSLLLIYLTT